MKPSINQVRSLSNVLMTNNWTLLMPKMPIQGGAFALPKDLNIQCESIEPPKMTSELVETQIRQFGVTSPGIAKPSGPITLTFIETVSVKILNFFSAWERSCFDPIFGKVGRKKSKLWDGSSFNNVEAIFTLLTLDNEGSTVFGYNLFGCILESFDPGNLDNANEIIRPTVTIKFDYFTTTEFGVSSISDAIAKVANNFDGAKSFVENFGV